MLVDEWHGLHFYQIKISRILAGFTFQAKTKKAGEAPEDVIFEAGQALIEVVMQKRRIYFLYLLPCDQRKGNGA